MSKKKKEKKQNTGHEFLLEPDEQSLRAHTILASRILPDRPRESHYVDTTTPMYASDRSTEEEKEKKMKT